jgi:hypothetical protein
MFGTHEEAKEWYVSTTLFRQARRGPKTWSQAGPVALAPAERGSARMRDDLQSLAELVDRIERTNEETSKIIAETKQLTAQADEVLKRIERYMNR